ncbi:Uncharacterised protein [Vibrio cholerae]|nr:Uncharacterised protein [Vibrio cholerae]
MVTAIMLAVGKYLRTERADLPASVATMISGAASFSAVSTAPLHTASVIRRRGLSRREPSSAFSTGSVRSAICAMIFTASTGYLPFAVSPESITASVPSMIAFATSPASARVGRGFLIIESSICVAVITTLRARLHFSIIIF